MARKLWLVMVLLLLMTSQACSLGITARPSGKIIYQTDEYDNFELQLFDVRWRSTQRLTNNSASDISPAYISTSNLIGFVSDQNTSWNLFTIDRNGENLTQVVDDEDITLDYPDWSPDGMLIAVSLVKDCNSESVSCMYDLYTLRADGGGLKRLTDTTESEWLPDWSPDGKKILFASDRDGDSDIYVIDAGGFNLIKLTNNSTYDGRPRWSPDGTQIAFETDRAGGDWDIFIMDADGKNPQAVTANSTNDFSQAWSPDGRWLVFVNNDDGDNELFMIDVDGQNLQRLTDNSTNDTAPVWIP